MVDESLAAKLRPLREGIDAMDREILGLVSRRARLAQEVGKVKEAAGAKGDDGQVLRPEREAQIVRALQRANDGPLPDEAVAAIWTEIISACRGLERTLTVAYLGPQGSFSEQAAFGHFGHSAQGIPCPNFDEVFRCVEAGQADVGMVAVENSTEGAVNRTLDLLLHSPLKILGEHSLQIRHCLMARDGMDAVKRILAHPQALAQCQEWLNREYPGVPRDAVSSNAEAARLAAADPSIAAIAGESAAEVWGLAVVAAGIQDDAQNRTRFLAIGKRDAERSGGDKTSLVFAVPNRAGAVYDMISPLARFGVSMTRFESRPARTGQWEYYFYVDVQGHRADENVAGALAALQERAAFFKILGSYPAQQLA